MTRADQDTVTLTAAARARLDRLRAVYGATDDAETLTLALHAAERAPGRQAAPESSAIPDDTLVRGRERALIAAYLRLGGREWRGTGPPPIDPACTVSPAVLAEYAAPLSALRAALAGM